MEVIFTLFVGWFIILLKKALKKLILVPKKSPK